MDNLIELLKIVDGALAGDRAQVRGYVELLAEKLERSGDKQAAGRLRRSLQRTLARDIQLMADSSRAVAVPVDGESHFSLADLTVESNVPLFLERDAVKDIEDFLSFVEHASTLIARGVGIAPRMLLFGPPGCGKSQVARFIAEKLGLALLTARADSLVSSFLGSTSKNIRQLFAYASQRPCVLFLDELDVLAKARDDAQELGELKRVVVSLLQNIDTLDENTVLIGATNHEHLLDPAVWRRFTFRIRVGLPSKAQRAQLFSHFLEGALQPIESLALAELSIGMSGAEIQTLCETERRRAIVAGHGNINILGLLDHIARLNEPRKKTDTDIKVSIASKLRKHDAETYTYRVLSQLLGVSLGHLSKSLKGV